MSLVSWIANSLIPSQSPNLTASDGFNTIGLTDGPEASGNAAYKAHRVKYSTENRTMETEEKEGRPPYLHVYLSISPYRKTGC